MSRKSMQLVQENIEILEGRFLVGEINRKAYEAESKILRQELATFKCPVDGKTMDGSFSVITCPSCSAKYCLYPCSEVILKNNGKCQVCGKFSFRKIVPKLKYNMHIKKLRELKKQGKVDEKVYNTLMDEYKKKALVSEES